MQIRTTEEQRKALHSLVEERKRFSIDVYSELRNEWPELFDMYLCEMDDEEFDVYPWASRLVMPAIFDAVETHLPHVVAEDLRFTATPRTGADPDKRKQVEAVLDYDVERARLPWKLVLAMKQALIYGASPMYFPYVYETEMQRKRSRQTIMQGTEFEMTVTKRDQEPTKVVTYDGPWFDVPDIFDVYPQPYKRYVNAPNGQGMDWIIHRFMVPYKKLVAMAKSGALIKSQVEKLKGQDPPKPGMGDGDGGREERESRLGINTFRADETMQQVEILAMWGDMGDLDRKGLVWLANGCEIIKVEEFPYDHMKLPFEFLVDIPLPNQVYGLGEARVLRPFQMEKSDIRNARMDLIHQIVNRSWKVLSHSNVDPAQLLSAPGQVIVLDAMDEIEEVQQAEVPFSTYQEEQLLQDDIERTAGQLDVLRGERIGGNRSSATENQLIAEFAAARVRIKIMSMKESLRTVGQVFLQLEQQMISDDKLVRLATPAGPVDIRVKPEDIAGEWDISIDIEQRLPVGKVQRRQNFMEMMNAVGPFVGEIIDPAKVAEEGLRVFGYDPQQFMASTSRIAESTTDPRAIAQQALAESGFPMAGGGPAPAPQEQITPSVMAPPPEDMLE